MAMGCMFWNPQSKSEKFLVGLILILIILILYIFVILPNKCLFVKNFDPKEINFEKPENISVLNVSCGNVIIELYPDISPVAVKRFKMLIQAGKYDDVAFHRVIKDVLVQAGDLEFGKKDNINYTYIGSGKSGFGTIKSEFNKGRMVWHSGSPILTLNSIKNGSFLIIINPTYKKPTYSQFKSNSSGEWGQTAGSCLCRLDEGSGTATQSCWRSDGL